MLCICFEWYAMFRFKKMSQLNEVSLQTTFSMITVSRIFFEILEKFIVFHRVQIVLHLQQKWIIFGIMNQLFILKSMHTNVGMLFSILFNSFWSQVFILMSKSFILFRFESSEWIRLDTIDVDGCGSEMSTPSVVDELALVFLFRSCNVTCGSTNIPSSSFWN